MTKVILCFYRRRLVLIGCVVLCCVVLCYVDHQGYSIGAYLRSLLALIRYHLRLSLYSHITRIVYGMEIEGTHSLIYLIPFHPI